jgi:hypothetical protein
MFERFTDRARRVLVLAQEEAFLLDHNFIGTEHLLLGLIHEDEGVAARSLKSLGVSYEVVFDKVEETIGPTGRARSASPPFTPRSKKVLELSLREARQLGHDYIGPEHLLLGLIREGQGVAVQVIQALGVNPIRVRERVMTLLRIPPAERGASPRHTRDSTAWARFPTRILAGPDRRLAADGFQFCVLGVHLHDDGVQIYWRLSGVPKPIADWLRNPAAFAPTLQNHRSITTIEIRDDLGTDYEGVQTTMAAQFDEDWAGSALFTPSVPKSASSLTVVWQHEMIGVEITR